MPRTSRNTSLLWHMTSVLDTGEEKWHCVCLEILGREVGVGGDEVRFVNLLSIKKQNNLENL